MYLCTDLTLWTTAYEIGQITRGGGRLFLVPPSISKTTHDLTTKMCTYMLQIVFFPILKQCLLKYILINSY